MRTAYLILLDLLKKEVFESPLVGVDSLSLKINEVFVDFFFYLSYSLSRDGSLNHFVLPLPPTKLRSLNSVSISGLVNTWETSTGSVAAVI